MKFDHLKYFLLAVLATVGLSGAVVAQDDGGGTTVINDFAQPIGGAVIDANGVLRTQWLDPRLTKQRVMAARQSRSSEVMQRSSLRKVSLNRLEAAVAEAIAAGQQPSEDMLALAGLTRIQYVFFYPETQDVVIAGPAEGVFRDAGGRFLGMDSGLPVVHLEDMVTALRAFSPDSPPTNRISVSIDPTPEGLAQMQKFMASLGGQARPGQERMITNGMKKSMGMQNVTLRGVPESTNFARVLVEADYRMKLIGIGLERVNAPLVSYTERSPANAASANSLQRWYFVPNYAGVAVSEDGYALQLNDRGVKLIGESELVDSSGGRASTQRANPASDAFCADFTQYYNDIARHIQVYAELRNLIDATVAAAYIQQQDFYQEANWSMATFGDESQFAVETHTAPLQVETAVNAVWKGNMLLTPIGGGIRVEPAKALLDEALVSDTDGSADALKQLAAPTAAEANRWWWD